MLRANAHDLSSISIQADTEFIYTVVILLHELINWNQGVWHDREFFQPESEEEIKEIKKPKSYSTTIGRNYVLVGQTPPAIRM